MAVKPKDDALPKENIVEPFDKPKATVAAEKEATKHFDEVLEIQRDNLDRQRTNVPRDGVVTVYATKVDGKDPESVTFFQTGNTLEVTTTAQHLTFVGQDQTALLRALAKVGPQL